MNVADQMVEAERKAIDSLARYKFMQFGYWAAIWVHLNRLDGKPMPSPFKRLVVEARRIKNDDESGCPVCAATRMCGQGEESNP